MTERDKGFTMVELQVASAIALIGLSAVLALYLFSWRNFTVGNAFLDVYSNSRNASGWLTRDIRCAAQIEPTCSFGGITYTTSDNVIVLKVPSTDNSNPPGSLSGYFDHIIYQLDGSDLKRIVAIDPKFSDSGDPHFNGSGRSDENSVIAKHCGSLTFSSGGLTLSNIPNLSEINTVSIYLPINKTTASVSGVGTQTASISPTTIARLRNK